MLLWHTGVSTDNRFCASSAELNVRLNNIITRIDQSRDQKEKLEGVKERKRVEEEKC